MLISNICSPVQKKYILTSCLDGFLLVKMRTVLDYKKCVYTKNNVFYVSTLYSADLVDHFYVNLREFHRK